MSITDELSPSTFPTDSDDRKNETHPQSFHRGMTGKWQTLIDPVWNYTY